MKDNLTNSVKTLHKGGVVAHPTETCYGLAVDIFQRKALTHLYSLKKMHLDKPVSILVRDLEEAQEYGIFSPTALKLTLLYWPGALTLVVPRTEFLPYWVNPGHKTIGIRLSSHKITHQLVEAFGGPLTTTSANIHGKPQAYAVQDFLDQGLQPDYTWDCGRIGEQMPSTIAEVQGDEIKILRQGEVKL